MGKKINYEATEEAQLTSEGRESDLAHLKANNARALPSSPTANGWSADAIKKQLYRPSEIIFAWLLRLASAQLALAKSVDDSLDGETKRLDLDIAGLRDLIDDIAQHGIAKFDDDYNVIKDTYVKKAQIVNNVTSEGESSKPLGAGQGYVLQNQIDHILTLLASDDTTLDELQEIVTYIKNNKSLIDGITTNKVNVSDIIDNLTSEIINKPLSANQGKVLKGLIDALQTVVNGKLDKSTSSEAKVYGVSNGSQTMWGVGQGANGSKLVQRTSAGQVNVPETPTADEHAASKKYVDTGLSSKATKTELDAVKDELDSASVDVIDYSMAKVSGKDDGLALPEESQLELKALRGNTVAWNKLYGNSGSSTTTGGIVATNNGDGTWTLNGTATEQVTLYIGGISGRTSGDVYIFGLSSGNIDGVSLRDQYTFMSSSAYALRRLDTATIDPIILIASGTTLSNKRVTPLITDLTKIYGAGNEPTSVDDPKAQWAINYALKHPAYDAGSLVSVDMSAYETEGFNQWDEEWESGSIGTNGEDEANASRFRSSYIPVLPNTEYFFFCQPLLSKPTASFPFYCYDANKNYIGRTTPELVNNSSFTTPSNCAYIRFRSAGEYLSATYNHNICINISDSSLNGTYKPYEKNSYPISFHGKSAGSVYDERKADGTDIVRIGSVDLGTLDWIKATSGSTSYFYSTTLTDKARGHNIICPKYETIDNILNKNNTISGANNSSNVYIRDDSLSSLTASDFKSAMSGVYLYYELATPVQSVNDPLPNAIKVYQDGTEWQINDGAPCGMEKDYDISLKGQVITNVRVDARQEEEIKELKETAMTAENVEGVKLWENGNPDTLFANQSVTTGSISEYSRLKVGVKISTSSDANTQYFYIDKALNKYAYLSLHDDQNANSYNRTIVWTDNTTATFGKGYVTGASATENNAACIPVAIYGIK